MYTDDLFLETNTKVLAMVEDFTAGFSNKKKLKYFNNTVNMNKKKRVYRNKEEIREHAATIKDKYIKK